MPLLYAEPWPPLRRHLHRTDFGVLIPHEIDTAVLADAFSYSATRSFDSVGKQELHDTHQVQSRRRYI